MGRWLDGKMMQKSALVCPSSFTALVQHRDFLFPAQVENPSGNSYSPQRNFAVVLPKNIWTRFDNEIKPDLTVYYSEPDC